MNLPCIYFPAGPVLRCNWRGETLACGTGRHLHDHGHRQPAVDANHQRLAAASGRRIVEMLGEDLKPSDIVTDKAVENATVVDMVLSDSANSIIHLVVMARRAGRKLELERFNEISEKVPVIANMKPTYLMENFYYAGGIQALLDVLREHLHLSCTTVNA